MQQQKSTILTTICSEVLSNLAFLFTEEEPGERLPDGSWLETTIRYKGPCAGTLKFTCTSDFSILLAANLLGIAPQDQEAQDKGRDAVKEFMNIVCGQLVTAIHGTDDVINLTIPEIRELSEAPEWTPEDNVDSTTLSVEGHLIRLSYLSAEENVQRS